MNNSMHPDLRTYLSERIDEWRSRVDFADREARKADGPKRAELEGMAVSFRRCLKDIEAALVPGLRS